MDRNRWKKISRIIDVALTVPEKDRTTTIQTLCEDDPDLLSEVYEWLHSLDDAIDESGLSETHFRKNDVLLNSAALDSADSDQHTLLEGQTIGQWKLTELLGRGGMGNVYKAERQEGKIKQVGALKILHQNLNTPENVHRFHQEQQILADLHHPNITSFIEAGISTNGTPYLVMEFVEGKPILAHCDEHRLSVKQRIQLFHEICKAVQHAHKKLVVHRDLKPDNILVTEEGYVKILDFGIAKLLDPDLYSLSTVETKESTRLLSLEYAAPEQVAGESITTSTDIYALGIILYELLAGIYPLNIEEEKYHAIVQIILKSMIPAPSHKLAGLTDSQQISKIAEARSTDPKTLIHTFKGDLDAIVLKALRKEAEHRYESVSHFMEDIEHYLHTRPVAARKGTFRYRLGKFVRRNRTVLTAAAIFLVIASGFGIYHVSQMAEQRDLAQQEAEKAGQVSAFLGDLFQASDPNESLGETVTARELLGKGTERIDELADQPEIQAAMMHVMGQSYTSLGLFEQAEPLLEEAMNVRRALFGSQHSETAESMHAMGKLMYERGELERSDSLLDEALSIRRELLGPYDPAVADVLMDITKLRWKQQRRNEVEPLAYEVLEIRRQAFPENDPRVAEALQGVADFIHTQGDFEEAGSLYRESLQIYRTHYGGVHLEVANTLFDLGYLAMGQSMWDEAESYFRQALDMKLQLQDGVYTERTVQILGALGRVFEGRGELEEAEATYRKGVEIIRDMGHRPTLAGGLHLLGALLMNQGRIQEAAPLFEESLEIRRQIYPPYHQLTLITQILLGQTRLALGENDSARQLLQDALPHAQTTFGEDHGLVVEAKQALAEMDPF